MKVILIGFLLFSVGAHAAKSDFVSLCKRVLPANKASTCNKIDKAIFKGKTDPVTSFSPKELGLRPLDIDDKIQYVVFNDPNFLSGFVYCYFVYRNWIDMAKVSPDDLGTHSSGFSVLNEQIDNYHRWLSLKPKGKSCEARVKKVSGVHVTDLRDSFKGTSAGIIAINPYSSILETRGNFEATIKNLQVTVDHERIHVYQVLYPKFDQWSKEQWFALPLAKKNEFLQKYPTYNWNDLKVAGREYIGYVYENRLDELEKIVERFK